MSTFHTATTSNENLQQKKSPSKMGGIRTKLAFLAFTALLFAQGCVSSKKYNESQENVETAREQARKLNDENRQLTESRENTLDEKEVLETKLKHIQDSLDIVEIMSQNFPISNVKLLGEDEGFSHKDSMIFCNIEIDGVLYNINKNRLGMTSVSFDFNEGKEKKRFGITSFDGLLLASYIEDSNGNRGKVDIDIPTWMDRHIRNISTATLYIQNKDLNPLLKKIEKKESIPNYTTYTVKKGDLSFFNIALRYGTYDELKALNPDIPNYNQIKIGQKINVPTHSKKVEKSAASDRIYLSKSKHERFEKSTGKYSVKFPYEKNGKELYRIYTDKIDKNHLIYTEGLTDPLNIRFQLQDIHDK